METYKKIRQLRKMLDLSQKRLGELAGVSRTQVGKIELGKIKNPRKDTLDRIAAVLGVTSEELFGRSAQHIKEGGGNIVVGQNEEANVLYYPTYTPEEPYKLYLGVHRAVKRGKIVSLANIVPLTIESEIIITLATQDAINNRIRSNREFDIELERLKES
jgi:transcriptional regulator with XRE-family HTH domain